jgi:hypothetical protein
MQLTVIMFSFPSAMLTKSSSLTEMVQSGLKPLNILKIKINHKIKLNFDDIIRN